MAEHINTVVVGAGQSGLSTSYYLTQYGREHVVLERASRPAHVWSDERWDSFTFVTPNWTIRLPGAVYSGSNPDGFLTRPEIIDYFAGYVRLFNPPLRYNTSVTSVEPDPAGTGYLVRTAGTVFEAANVVMATGLLQIPKKPPVELPDWLTQLHSSQYRNPRSLPAGAVLVVGTGQSGAQIAEELYQSGRTVYLSVSSAGRAPRRYRGRDVFSWLEVTGFISRPADTLPSPKMRFAGGAHVSGRDGGHDLNLHTFAHDGVILLGHIRACVGNRIQLAPDLHENLAKGDAFEAQVTKMVDEFVSANGLDAPAQTLPVRSNGFAAPPINDLDLHAAGISTVIWANGFSHDPSMVKLPFTDSDGFPVQERGVTAYPGLYVAGLPWLPDVRTGLLLGVAAQAEHVAGHIAKTAGLRR